MKFDRQRAIAPEDGLLPLIDIILMLLIFFMLAGKLAASDPLDVSPPNSQSESQLEERELVVVLGPDGQLAFDGELLSRQDFETALRDRVASSPDSRFWLKADAEADSNDVIAVMEVLRAAGVERLKLLTLQNANQDEG